MRNDTRTHTHQTGPKANKASQTPKVTVACSCFPQFLSRHSVSMSAPAKPDLCLRQFPAPTPAARMMSLLSSGLLLGDDGPLAGRLTGRDRLHH